MKDVLGGRSLSHHEVIKCQRDEATILRQDLCIPLAVTRPSRLPVERPGFVRSRLS